ncbi:hypothetical protein [Sphingomonas sp. dw_22]|uniref:hypothetical protein n=1 Tax=Sphingomonas sp. dw_22 TaxID=2721175 RepID=UPI001BD4730C|nr:hypothetical protein [Sphingomonas sp. dw_22]
MIWWVALLWLPFAGLSMFGGRAIFRHARKLADATIDFEARGPIKPPAWHTGQKSRAIETAGYKFVGAFVILWGALLGIVCLANLAFSFFQ